jgi:hypothetical protein
MLVLDNHYLKNPVKTVSYNCFVENALEDASGLTLCDDSIRRLAGCLRQSVAAPIFVYGNYNATLACREREGR